MVFWPFPIGFIRVSSTVGHYGGQFLWLVLLKLIYGVLGVWGGG